MGLEITIKNKSAKKLPGIDVLTDGDRLKYGAFDGTRLNLGEKGPDGSITMFNPERIGRGISVGFLDNAIGFFVTLPTARGELEDLFEAALRVSDYWGGKVEANVKGGGSFDLHESEKLIEKAEKEGLTVLNRLLSGEIRNPLLFCARWPLFLDEGDIENIKNDDAEPLEAFGKLIHKMQSIDAYYAAPNIMSTKHRDCIFGMFVLTEGIVSIAPVAPRTPYGLKDRYTNRPVRVEDWYVCLYSNKEQKILGHLLYSDFLRCLKPEDYVKYDAQNILLKGLTRERIDFMLKKFGTLPPNS